MWIVFPAQAGTHCSASEFVDKWVPACAGKTMDFGAGIDMHDLRWIRENPEEFDHGLGRRGLVPRAAEVLGARQAMAGGRDTSAGSAGDAQPAVARGWRRETARRIR